MPDEDEPTSLEDALCAASKEGADIAELMRATGMGRSTVYCYLAQFVDDSRAVQVS